MPKNIVVGYVKSKIKHENAEKLSVCQVDVGGETLQIVCGAKNVEAGQFVPVALSGAVMPSGLEIKRAKLRGAQSNGMICTPFFESLAQSVEHLTFNQVVEGSIPSWLTFTNVSEPSRIPGTSMESAWLLSV